MSKTWAEMTEAEREEINRQEDRREAQKAAMYWSSEEEDYYQGDPRRCPDGLHDPG